ncbi:MAG: NifB/NifX family molybdenum-iron cluster-binding protein [Candidatus Zixiibacteriota bacterium]
MIVAIPKYNEIVAPCFEVAGTFLLAEIENGRTEGIKVEQCAGCEGFGRIRFLQDNNVKLLICNGIKNFYKDLLVIAGMTVIKDVSMPVEEALAMYTGGRLREEKQPTPLYYVDSEIPVDDIICWTRDLFRANGYEVVSGEDVAPFPIDLVARMTCPLCGKPVRVAICCGAHSYRVDQEILTFHRASVSDFHAQVYVHPALPDLKKNCDEFGIELLDPLDETFDKTTDFMIPILRNPVSGHEQAFGKKRKRKRIGRKK